VNEQQEAKVLFCFVVVVVCFFFGGGGYKKHSVDSYLIWYIHVLQDRRLKSGNFY